MAMNLFDKAIAVFSPEKAYKRASYRAALDLTQQVPAVAPTPTGAKRGFRAWRVSSANADGNILPILEDTRARCRDLYENNPLGGGAVKTMVTNVIGSGLKKHPHIDRELLGMTDEQADAWEKKTQREWALWSESRFCDASLHDNFSGMQALAFLTVLTGGDALATMPWAKRTGFPYDLRVQLIEGDRLVQPYTQPQKDDFAGGIETDRYGAPVAYHFAKTHPGSLFDMTGAYNTERIPAFGSRTGRRNVIHLFHKERPEQRRGRPFLAPVMEPLKQIGRYTDAELMAAVVSAMLTVFVKKVSPANGDVLESPLPDEELVAADDPNIYELGNGAIIGLGENEDIGIVNPLRPNSQFDPFWISMLKQFGAGLNLPFEIVLKFFSASYSASRGALLEARRVFMSWREWMACGFCQPVYEEFLTEAVIRNRIQAPGFLTDPLLRAAYSAGGWVGPAQGHIDPEKEARAAKIRVDEGFSTREREAMEISGDNFDDINRQRSKEEAMRRDGKWSVAETEAIAESGNAPDDGENNDGKS